jgi:hypothetical protein
VRRLTLPCFILCLIQYSSFSQSADTLRRTIMIDFEARPRGEFRDNFMLAASDSIMPEIHATQRNRASVTYTGTWLKFHTTPQEIHVWGKSGNASRVGSINAFEFYFEPEISKRISMRIGRQALSLDNGRLFSAAPWSQQGRSHEGIRFIYKNKVTTDLTIAITRPYGKHFDAAYSPDASHVYKFLLVHHLKYRLSEHFDLTTINAADVFEKNKEPGQYYERVTNGGRLEYNLSGFYATISGYYQYGKTAASKIIRAYYIQPEVSIKVNKATVRLGGEILSGNKAGTPDHISNSFVPLYGVAWKFMGNMNLFTRFPADVDDKGLINPYLFVIYKFNKKLLLRADGHLFFSQYVLPVQQGKAEKYLGFENDISINFKLSERIEMIGGFSYTIAKKQMETLKKVVDSNKIPVWSYLMISYTPRILHVTNTR